MKADDFEGSVLITKSQHRNAQFESPLAESREFRPQNCAISVPSVRAGRTRSAQTHPKHFWCRAMHSCAFRNALAGAGRVSRGKIAPTFGEIVIVERFDLPLIESIEFSNLLQSNYSISGFHVFGFIKENISFAGPSVAVFIEWKQTFDASL